MKIQHEPMKIQYGAVTKRCVCVCVYEPLDILISKSPKRIKQTKNVMSIRINTVNNNMAK